MPPRNRRRVHAVDPFEIYTNAARLVKERLFLLVFLAIIAAPRTEAQQWTSSIKIGGASTVFKGDLAAGPTTWERRTGLAASASLGLDLGNGLSPMVEASYVRMGSQTSVRYLGVPATLRSNLTYLAVPLLLQYRLNTRSNLHPRVFAGPVVAIQLDALIVLTARDGGATITEQDDSVEGIEYGAVVGAALDIDIVSQRLTLEGRFYSGQRDITKPDLVLGDTVLKNQGIIILVGILF